MSEVQPGQPVGSGPRLLLRRCALGLGVAQIGLGLAVLAVVFPSLEQLGCHPETPLGVWACNVPALRREEQFALGIAVLMLVSAAFWPERWHISAIAGGLVPGLDGAYLASVSWIALLLAAASFGLIIAAALDYWWLRRERDQEAERLERERRARLAKRPGLRRL